MSKKNRNKGGAAEDPNAPLEEQDQQNGEDSDDNSSEEVQPEELESTEVAETPLQNLKRRIKEATANLAASAVVSNTAREDYMKAQQDYDDKFTALNEERNQVSKSHQDYIDASDNHARIQGQLAKLEGELASK